MRNARMFCTRAETDPGSIEKRMVGKNNMTKRPVRLLGLSLKADSAEFLAVYPAGKNKRWQAGKCCGARSEAEQDITFLTKVLDKVTGAVKVDKECVYVSLTTKRRNKRRFIG